MKTKISVKALGAVAPYVVSASRVIPLVLAVGVVEIPPVNEPRPVVRPDERGMHRHISAILTHDIDIARPDLTPVAIVPLATSGETDTYESFVASEGWHEEMVLEGPFVVVEEQSPAVFFDEYDKATVALYEQWGDNRSGAGKALD